MEFDSTGPLPLFCLHIVIKSYYAAVLKRRITRLARPSVCLSVCLVRASNLRKKLKNKIGLNVY